MIDIKPNNPPAKGNGNSIENIVGGSKVPLNLLGSPTRQMDYHPTDAEPEMRWGTDGTGHIDVGGGAGVRGGYSIIPNPENPDGESSVVYYKD